MNKTYKRKWITFRFASATEKTQTWNVYENRFELFLGTIKWSNGWRQYAFFPQPETLFEGDCLKAIANFIKKLMKEKIKVGER